MTKHLTPHETLCNLIAYNQQTGILIWKWRDRAWFAKDMSWRSWNTKHAGKEALGCVDRNGTGYKHGSISPLNLSKAYAHRVAFELFYGGPPRFSIDHINGDRTDNRIANLRDVSHKINGKNLPKSKRNTSGIVGVYWNGECEKWCANISVDGKTKYLGLFSNIEHAIAVRKAAELRYGFHANHGRDALC